VKRRIFVLLGLAVLLTATMGAAAAVAPAQNTGTNSDGRAAPAQKNTMSVVIHHHAFDPEQQNVPPGTTVTWTNEDTEAHTVTADNGLFDSGVLNPGESYSVWFDGSGNVTYHCEIHPDMTGSVVVGGASGNGGTITGNPANTPTQTASGTQNVPSGNATQILPGGARAAVWRFQRRTHY
jgi:plastocyanin